MPEALRKTTAQERKVAALRVSELAARQDGVVSRRQLVELGLGEGVIDRWLAAGRLHRIHHGVYALGHRNIGMRGRLIAALLYAGPGAALSHTTAAWWLGLLTAEPRVIHLSVRGRCANSRGVRIHHPRELDVTRHNGLPVTTVARTLLDLAAMLPFTDLRRALAEADFRGLLDVDSVATMIGRGRPGSAALRTALEVHLPELAETRSLLEEEFLPLCQKAALPIPEVNAPIEGKAVDALWRRERVIVELDGGAGHGSIARMRADRARDLDLRERGYVVLRYSAVQLRREPDRVAAEVRRNLQGSSA